MFIAESCEHFWTHHSEGNLLPFQRFSFVHLCKNCRHITRTLDLCLSHTAEQHSAPQGIQPVSQRLCVAESSFSSSQNPCHELWQHTRYHRLLTLTSYWACAPVGLLVDHSASAFWKTCARDSGDPQNRCNRETQSLRLPLETLTSPLPYIYFCFCKCSNYV